MFRELRRKNKQIGHKECVELLEKEKRGVLSVIGDGGYPYGTPMNHFYNKDDGCIYFHCGHGGHRLDSVKRDPRASFCVCENGERHGDDWAYTVRSVIVFGKIEIIDDTECIASICERLCRKFTDDESYISNEIEKFAKATLLLRLTPEHICGKKVKEE